MLRENLCGVSGDFLADVWKFGGNENEIMFGHKTTAVTLKVDPFPLFLIPSCSTKGNTDKQKPFVSPRHQETFWSWTEKNKLINQSLSEMFYKICPLVEFRSISSFTFPND